MNKEVLMAKKSREIRALHNDIAFMKATELNRVYKKNVNYQQYGYIERYNKESCCFVIIACNISLTEYYNDRSRGNIEMLGYYLGSQILIPVKRIDLLLLIGLTFKSVAFERILKGTSKLKLD